MPCYKALQAYRGAGLNANGKRGVSFSTSSGFRDQPIDLPCGQCIGCRLERSRQWAVRCMHEASLHDANSFITCTYNEQHLPLGASLIKKDFQDFMKRLRRSTSGCISYLQCGEYGGQLGRPHYHAILFGIDFADKKFYKMASDELGELYTSPKLEELWGKGFCTTGAVTFESAAYVARYALKKITGDNAPGWYTRLDPETGELQKLQPEYLAMSLRPAIGKRWFEQFGSEVFPSDEVIVRGHQSKPPRYYLKQLELREAITCVPGDKKTLSKSVKLKRVLAVSTKKARIERGRDRQRVKEVVKTAQIQSLKRTLL